MTHQRVSPADGRAADDTGSLIESAVAIIIVGVAAMMIITLADSASRINNQEWLRSEALQMIERYSTAVRRIDCVQNAAVSALSSVCGPAPAAGGYKVELDEGTGPGESGHELIEVEWVDYYLTSDLSSSNCESLKPPRAVREITVTWSADTNVNTPSSLRSITRTVRGPSVPLTYGWTAQQVTAAARHEFTYLTGNLVTEKVYVPSYGPSTAGGTRNLCQVVVAPVGADLTYGVNKKELHEGWNVLSSWPW